MKKIISLTFFIFMVIFIQTPMSHAEDQPKPIMIATHVLAYGFQNHDNSFIPTSPLKILAKKSENNTISSLDQLVIEPNNEYKNIVISLIKINADGKYDVIEQKTSSIPSYTSTFIMDLNTIWNISNKPTGKYLFTVSADESEEIGSFPFNISD